MKHAKQTENLKYTCREAMNEKFPRLLLIPNEYMLKNLKIGDYVALNETDKTDEFVEYSELTWWKVTDRNNDDLLLVRTSVPGLIGTAEEFPNERKETKIENIVLIRNMYPGIFDRTQFKNTYESIKEPYCMATMKAFNDRHVGIVLKSIETYNENDTGYELYSGDEYLNSEYMSNSRNLAYFNIGFAKALFPAVKDILANKHNDNFSEYKYDKSTGMYIENINKEISDEMQEYTIAEITEDEDYVIEEIIEEEVVEDTLEPETFFEEPETVAEITVEKHYDGNTVEMLIIEEPEEEHEIIEEIIEEEGKTIEFKRFFFDED